MAERFFEKEVVNYPNGGSSRFYVKDNTAVIIDDHICDVIDNTRFPYSLITDKQNSYMNEYDHVFRFLKEDVDDIDQLDLSISSDLTFTLRTSDRADNAEASPLERLFEERFGDVYGSKSLSFLNKEFGIVDEEGNNYYLDYFIQTKTGKIAVEENGITYHHPQEIGVERYRKQLKKQNACTKLGIKLFRFSTEDCQFTSRMDDDIQRFFGEDPNQFIEPGVLAERPIKLYEHQETTLEDIVEARKEGIKTFLIVLPTASGKSKIVEEDMKVFSKGKKDFHALVLAPNTNIINDWHQRIDKSLKDLDNNIKLWTYAYGFRHYTEYQPTDFDYIVIDEAHHAVAPVLKRMIQYFNPKFMIGLTATDQRPDKKKLEDIFGSYQTHLSLLDAMKKGIIATANVYRIETNIDLSHVRINGRDYVNADLEKSIRVTSRNELIVQVLKDYFCEGEAGKRQGLIFCVNVRHANEMAKLMNEAGLFTAAYIGQTKKPEKVMEDFKNHKIRFLCTVNMISEGWDYPELGILVMARPTLSKVLYQQQIGRGLRKTDVKKNVFIIDVVDEYGTSMTIPCSMHTLFHNPMYVPFGDITKRDYKPGDFIEVDGLSERVERIVEVNVDDFEERYGDYYSTEQVAREYFVNTGTINSWIKKGTIVPTASFVFGSKKIYMFSPEDVQKYREELNIPVHNDETIKEDFFDFLEQRDYSLSYKMPFVLGFIDHMNNVGEAKIEDVLDDYIAFYKDRIERGLPVDRSTCPYNSEHLKDRKYIKRSMLTNPFEKFERKRFMYYSKDLGVIAMNHALLEKLTNDDIERIRNQMNEDLVNYFENLGGM